MVQNPHESPEHEAFAGDQKEPRYDSWSRVLNRSMTLAFFFAPSVVGAGGPTGAFFLPGPAFLMLLFGQWRFKFWLGVLPIVVAWPVFLLVCCSRAAAREASRRGGPY
jgi:hypothetical protein